MGTRPRRLTMVVLVAAVGLLAGCAGAGGGPAAPLARVGGVVIDRPDEPRLTYVVPAGEGAAFVAQTVSFVSRTAGTVSSRRPAAHDTERPAAGVAPGLEWRLLWLRAVNCESAARTIDFAVVDGSGRHLAPVTPPQKIPPGGAYSWVPPPGTESVVPSGHAVAARWSGMEGAGATGCSWQFGALEAPAGTPAPVATSGEEVEVRGRFTVDQPGLHASWRAAPDGRWSQPVQVTAGNCEAAPRQVEAVVLSPDRLVFGQLPDARAHRMLDPGASVEWSGPQLLLPPGWSIGVRWLDMAGSGHVCAWSASLQIIIFDEIVQGGA